jgi:nucleoside-triphosphatase
MNNIFISVEKGQNYANDLLGDIMSKIDCSIGGYWVDITRDEENHHIRIFDLTSLLDGQGGNIFFRKDDSTGISKLNIDVFNTKGKDILSKSYKDRELIVMNEIGFLESKASEFTEEVKKILDSSKVVLGVIKNRKCPYIDSIKARGDMDIIKLTDENRSAVRDEVIERLKSHKVPLSKLIR